VNAIPNNSFYFLQDSEAYLEIQLLNFAFYSFFFHVLMLISEGKDFLKQIVKYLLSPPLKNSVDKST